MRVTLPQALTVSETFTLARFGELALSSGGRLPQPTNVAAPGAAAWRSRRRTTATASCSTTPTTSRTSTRRAIPPEGSSASNTLRVGDRVTGVDRHPRAALRRLPRPAGRRRSSFDAANPRPRRAAGVGGTLRVASFNVLNYFNGDGRAAGFPTARGANTPAEFERQRAKTIAAARPRSTPTSSA